MLPIWVPFLHFDLQGATERDVQPVRIIPYSYLKMCELLSLIPHHLILTVAAELEEHYLYFIEEETESPERLSNLEVS